MYIKQVVTKLTLSSKRSLPFKTDNFCCTEALDLVFGWRDPSLPELGDLLCPKRRRVLRQNMQPATQKNAAISRAVARLESLAGDADGDGGGLAADDEPRAGRRGRAGVHL